MRLHVVEGDVRLATRRWMRDGILGMRSHHLGRTPRKQNPHVVFGAIEKALRGTPEGAQLVARPASHDKKRRHRHTLLLRHVDVQMTITGALAFFNRRRPSCRNNEFVIAMLCNRCRHEFVSGIQCPTAAGAMFQREHRRVVRRKWRVWYEQPRKQLCELGRL